MPRLSALCVVIVALGAVAGSSAALAQPTAPQARRGHSQADRLVVTSRDGRTEVVSLPSGSDLDVVAASYRRRADVISAEPSWIYRISGVPNDPGMGSLWGLHNVGQQVANTGVSGTADVDIDAPEGWAAAYGEGRYPSTGGAVVGVIDTGIDATHPDLAGKVVACASGTTGTGAVVAGVCLDDNGHGTHIAGTVAALAGNSVGVAGVAPDSSLAVFKAMDATGQGADVDIAAGIRWMRALQVDVINMSFGDPQSSSVLSRELSAAAADGIVLVAAAGNDGDATANFPATHTAVISVAAVDAWGARPAFSNCNSDVEVAAPGVNIVSTVPGAGYARFSGTSMAAPHVSGVAAVLRSARALTAPATRSAIVSRTQGSGGCNGVGILNLAAALGNGAPPPPSPPPPVIPRAVVPSPVAADRAGRFIALTPTRIVDSRVGLGIDGGRISGGSSRDLAVAGQGGVPTTGVSAVVVNLTATGSTAQTYLTAYPAGMARPLASALNVAAQRSAAALVTVGLAQGRIAVYNHAGSVDVVLDVVGYYTDGSRDEGVGYAVVEPTRLLDTRVQGSPVIGGTSRELQITGRAGVPATGVVAAVVNITVTAPTRASFVTAFPAGQDRPPTSSVNVAVSETRANLAVVALDAAGRIALFNSAGASHLIVDVLGWYGEGAVARFVPITPQRVLDTRMDGAAVPSGTSVPVELGLPAGAVAVVATVTATGPTSSGYLTAHPAGRAPGTSTVNFPAAATVANLAVVPLGDDGRIAVRNGPGRTHALVDVVGYFLS